MVKVNEALKVSVVDRRKGYIVAEFDRAYGTLEVRRGLARQWMAEHDSYGPAGDFVVCVGAAEVKAALR